MQKAVKPFIMLKIQILYFVIHFKSFQQCDTAIACANLSLGIPFMSPRNFNHLKRVHLEARRGKTGKVVY